MASTTVVKATETNTWPSRSELSVFDQLTPSFRIWLSFFYSYHVSPEKVENALANTLSRYGELAGRVINPDGTDSPYVDMNNAGAQLTSLETSKMTLDEVKGKNYDINFVYEHFGYMDFEPDGFLCKVRMQQLACGGMYIAFGCDHRICDINSMYLFETDLASQIKSGSFLYPANEMVLYKRREIFKVKEDSQAFDHHEFVVMTLEDFQKLSASLGASLFGNLDKTKIFKLHITSAQMRNLKSEVLAEYNGDLKLSTNDCIMSALLHAHYASLTCEGSESAAFQFICNTRLRLDPQLPKTFFGNAVYYLPRSRSVSEWRDSTLLEVACGIRETIAKIENERIYSAVAYLQDRYNSTMHLEFSAGMGPRDFNVSNWNSYYDWYGGMDFGQGGPAKFLLVANMLFNMALVFPHESDGIEIVTSTDKTEFDAFVGYPQIAKYFTVV